LAKSITLSQLNNGNDTEFLAAVGDVFEHSPWLANRAAKQRPFETRTALISALLDAMNAASDEEKLALIRAHPDLARKAARSGGLSHYSTQEQASAGLDRLSEDEYRRFNRLNNAYQEKFGFPFIIAVLDHTKDSIFQEFETRLEQGAVAEINEAILNIGRIVSLRVINTVKE